MDVGQLELAPALDIDQVRPVDQDVRTRSDRAAAVRSVQTDHVVDNVLGDLLLLLLVEQEPPLVGELDDELCDARLQVGNAHADRQRGIDSAQDLFMNQHGRRSRSIARVAQRPRCRHDRGLDQGSGALRQGNRYRLTVLWSVQAHQPNSLFQSDRLVSSSPPTSWRVSAAMPRFIAEPP